MPIRFVGAQPQAVMMTGRLYDEATVLGAALAFERATRMELPTIPGRFAAQCPPPWPGAVVETMGKRTTAAVVRFAPGG